MASLAVEFRVPSLRFPVRKLQGTWTVMAENQLQFWINGVEYNPQHEKPTKLLVDFLRENGA